MTDSMREKMARRMCAAAGENWDAVSFQKTASGAEPEDARDYWRIAADAALDALEEPTEEMMLAMRKEHWDKPGKWSEVFRATLRAARTGKATP